MRLKILIIIIFFLFAALTMGCGVTASVSATDLTQPVLLGKIKRLHGTDNEQWQLRVPFDIDISNRRANFGSGNTYFWCRANSELLKLTDTSDDKIIIEEVYIGSYSLFFAGPGSSAEEGKSWADIKGGIYHEQAGGHETK